MLSVSVCVKSFHGLTSGKVDSFAFASQFFILFYSSCGGKDGNVLAAGSTVWSQIPCVVNDDLELNARSSNHSPQV